MSEGGDRIAEYLVPDSANRIPKIVLLTDIIDNWDAEHFAQAFCKRYPMGAFIDQNRLVKSPTQVQLSPDLSKRGLFDAILFNREVEALAVAIPHPELLEVATLLGPIDTVVTDVDTPLTHQPNLPFLGDVEQISAVDFEKD